MQWHQIAYLLPLRSYVPPSAYIAGLFDGPLAGRLSGIGRDFFQSLRQCIPPKHGTLDPDWKADDPLQRGQLAKAVQVHTGVFYVVVAVVHNATVSVASGVVDILATPTPTPTPTPNPNVRSAS